MKSHTILLCDDHTAVREGLRLLLEDAEDLRVVDDVGTGFRAVRETKRLLPHVVVVDLSTPLVTGLETTRQIAREVPSTNLLMLSALTESQYVRQAIEAGAAGYLTKDTTGNELLRAVREVAKGKAYFSPPIARYLEAGWQDRFRHGASIAIRSTTLTWRQTAILKLIAKGYANKQIADRLSLSIKTVEKHRQALMNRLDIHNIASLTQYAIAVGAIELSCPPQLANYVASGCEPGGCGGRYHQSTPANGVAQWETSPGTWRQEKPGWTEQHRRKYAPATGRATCDSTNEKKQCSERAKPHS